MRNNMTRRAWLQSSTAALACLALPEYALGAAAEKNEVSRVWMTKEISPEALVRIYQAMGRTASGRVAVKISTGEPGGRNFLSPALIKGLVHHVKGTIVECNTAYGGKRSRTEDHLKAAKDHGFSDIARVDIMDAEGEFTIPVKDRKHLEYDIVGSHLKNYDFMINLAHFKGHAMGGFGGSMKNIAIGCASGQVGKRREGVHPFRRKNAGRCRRVEQSGRAGRFSGVHGRLRSGGGRLLRGQDSVYQRDEQAVH